MPEDMTPEQAKAYGNDIGTSVEEITQRNIATMTPTRAIKIIKEAVDIIGTAPDPEGENLPVEMRLWIVTEWLAHMEGK